MSVLPQSKQIHPAFAQITSCKFYIKTNMATTLKTHHDSVKRRTISGEGMRLAKGEATEKWIVFFKYAMSWI